MYLTVKRAQIFRVLILIYMQISKVFEILMKTLDFLYQIAKI